MNQQVLIVTVGVEIEGGVQCGHGAWYPVKDLLARHGNAFVMPDAGMVVPELGHQFEIITAPAQFGQQLQQYANQLAAGLKSRLPQGGCSLVYQPYLEFTKEQQQALLSHPAQSPRVRAQIAALMREGGDVAEQALCDLTCACSTHVHLGLVDQYGIMCNVNTPAYRVLGLLLRNLCECMGPWWARWLAREAHIRDDPRRQASWYRFAPPRRPVGNQWFSTWDEYVAMFKQLAPRMIRPVLMGDEMVYEVDLKTRPRPSDPISLKGIWNQGRFSPLGTVESRGAPSVHPMYATMYAGHVRQTAMWALAYYEQHGPHIDRAELYRFLREHMGDFIPDHVLTDEEWYELAMISPQLRARAA